MSTTHTIIWEIMEFCNLILVSTIGYSILLLHDVSQLGTSRMLPRLTLVSYPLIIYPYIYIPLTYEIAVAPLSAAHISLIAGIMIFFALLLYSVLLEIPLRTRKQVGNPKSKDSADTLRSAQSTGRTTYDRGTYRLCRHPGFIWFTIVNILYGILYLQRGVTQSMAVLTICNLILIILEDTLIFPRIFSDYDSYRDRIPFLNIFHR